MATRTKPPYQQAKATALAKGKKIAQEVSKQGVLGEAKRQAARKGR